MTEVDKRVVYIRTSDAQCIRPSAVYFCANLVPGAALAVSDQGRLVTRKLTGQSVSQTEEVV